MDGQVESAVPTVLVVDDDLKVLQSAKRSLRGEWAVRLAHDLDSARRSFDTKRPQFVLLDLRLRDENGLDFARAVRSEDPLFPIAVLSGRVTADIAFELNEMKIGVVAEKPVKFLEVLRELKAASPGDPTRCAKWLKSGRRPEVAPSDSLPAQTLAEARGATDRHVITTALERNNWNVSRTARVLGISRAGLNAMIKVLQLKRGS